MLNTTRDTAWLTSKEFAAALDLRYDYVCRAIIPSLPREMRRKVDGRLLIHGRQALEFVLTPRLFAQAKKEVLAELEAAKAAEIERDVEILLLMHGGTLQ